MLTQNHSKLRKSIANPFCLVLVLRWASGNRKQFKRDAFQRLRRVITKCSTEKCNAYPQTKIAVGIDNDDDSDENDEKGKGDETAR